MFGIPLMAIVVILIAGISVGFMLAAVFTAGTINDLRTQADNLRAELCSEIAAHNTTRARLVRLTDRDERGRFVRREAREAI